MNLNRYPLVSELRDLLHGGDPKEHNLLWVDREGEVHLEAVEVPVVRMGETYGHRVWHRTYAEGSGDVGWRAASDVEHVVRLYDEILKAWRDYKRRG
jgi:hypothetical protein